MAFSEEIVPSKFMCPLTSDIMEDPVMTREGHSFEKSAILSWLSRHSTCPMTYEPLEISQLVANHALRNEIHAWRARRMFEGHNDISESATELHSEHDGDDSISSFYGNEWCKHDSNMFVFNPSFGRVGKCTGPGTSRSRHRGTTKTIERSHRQQRNVVTAFFCRRRQQTRVSQEY